MSTLERLTESYYPRDESEEIWDATIGDALRGCAQEVPDRIFLVDAVPDPSKRRTWTYAEFLRDAERLARALLGRFEPGEHIGVLSANCPEFMLVQHAVGLAGMRLVALNPAYREHELRYILGQSQTAGLFHASSHRGFDLGALIGQLEPELPLLRETIAYGEDFDAFAASGDPTTRLPDIDPGNVVQIQYTSGTTGFPKGAMLHHRGVLNAGRFAVARGGFSDGGVWVNAMPLYHVGASATTQLGTLAYRGTYVLMREWDPGLMLELFETYRGTATLVVPTMLLALLDHPDGATRDLSSIETIYSGAAVVPAALVRRTKETLDCGFSIWFGQTELNGVATATRSTDSPEDQAETVGQPLPQTEVRIADRETGETLPLGERGDICVRGYQTMVGYFDRADESAETLDDDGWLWMGDIGTMDDRGYVTITGRSKEMIIRGGINVYPREIEDVLFGHAAVAQVAVVGVPDEKWGERIVAAILAKDPSSPPSPDELKAYCRQKLAAHKTPAGWIFVDAFPTTASGKVQKFVLLEQIASGALVPVNAS
jgi:acyl-CoA synthetase (AMP-forming)/AMP-acid ligase II